MNTRYSKAAAVVYGLLAIVQLAGVARAAPVATGPSSWRDSETGKVRRAVGPGTPINYQRDDGVWERIDPRWTMQTPSTWGVVKGKHHVRADAAGGAEYIVRSSSRRYILGTKTTRLILVDMADTSWSHYEWLAGRGGVIRGNRLAYTNTVPGLDKVLIYEPDAYREHFIFDMGLLRKASAVGTKGQSLMLGTATRLELDSLGLRLTANGSDISFEGKGTFVERWATAMDGDSAVWHIAEAFVETPDSSTTVRVSKWFVTIDSIPHLVEMFSLSNALALSEPFLAHDAWFGSKTSSSSNLSIENQIAGSPFTCPTPGYGDSITAYMNITGSSGSPKVSCALYSVGSSSGSFIDSTYTRSISVDEDAGAAWESLELASRPSLSANTRYFILNWAESGSWAVNARLRATGGEDTTSVDMSQSFGNWPGTFNRDFDLDGYESSIYLTYTENWPRRRFILLRGGN